MNKTSLILGATVFLALLIALTTAKAGMVQAKANTIQATANTIQSTSTLVSQCITGLMVIVALTAGLVIGHGVHVWRNSFFLRRGTGLKWLPGPDARWGRLTNIADAQPIPSSLPHPFLYTLPSPTQTQPSRALTMADLEGNFDDDEGLMGSHWGF